MANYVCHAFAIIHSRKLLGKPKFSGLDLRRTEVFFEKNDSIINQTVIKGYAINNRTAEINV